jgi:hypothetical protein
MSSGRIVCHLVGAAGGRRLFCRSTGRRHQRRPVRSLSKLTRRNLVSASARQHGVGQRQSPACSCVTALLRALLPSRVPVACPALQQTTTALLLPLAVVAPRPNHGARGVSKVAAVPQRYRSCCTFGSCSRVAIVWRGSLQGTSDCGLAPRIQLLSPTPRPRQTPPDLVVSHAVCRHTPGAQSALSPRLANAR